MLFNGDRLTGEVKELFLGQLQFKTDNLGTTSIEWDKIVSVSAIGEFELQLVNGDLLLGSISAGPSEGEMTLDQEAGQRILDLSSILRITRIKRSFWDRIDGKLDLGASYNQASEVGQLTMHSDAMIKRPGFWVGYDLNLSFTRQRETEDTAWHRLNLSYYYMFASRWTAITVLGVEQNRELGFDLRTSANVGAGRFLVQRHRTMLIGGIGMQVNRETPRDGDTVTNVAALFFVRYTTFFFDFPHTDVDAALRVFPDLGNSGRVRLEADVSLNRELLKNFYLSLSLLESFDSEPPTPDARRNDVNVTLSLGWSF